MMKSNSQILVKKVAIFNPHGHRSQADIYYQLVIFVSSLSVRFSLKKDFMSRDTRDMKESGSSKKLNYFSGSYPHDLCSHSSFNVVLLL
jgi:hypothetical protein